jgi:nucleotide-binding universal stress UspA family protein
MFKHLLIPLDGSEMSEAVLGPAGRLAALAGARVTLLHVVERDAPATVHGQRHLTDAAEAEQYLRGVAERAFPPGVQAGWHVHLHPTDGLAESLARHADELHPDVIVMCAHGGVRLRDRLRGNLSQQVIHRRVLPVLVLQAARGRECFPFRHILVPLDGQAPHEQGIQPAAELARLCGAHLTLMTVVPTLGSLPDRQAATASLLPGATREVLDLRVQRAAEYLQRHLERLREEGLDAAARVERGDPARQILAAVKADGVDLIVLGTHGRAGTEAFWSGSLTPKLLRRARTSFLLVPVPQQ